MRDNYGVTGTILQLALKPSTRPVVNCCGIYRAEASELWAYPNLLVVGHFLSGFIACNAWIAKKLEVRPERATKESHAIER